MLTWRVGGVWYAVALLTAPLVYLLVLLALSLTSPVFQPGIMTASDKVMFLLIGTAPGFLVGCLEELGWTGFAIPRLRLRYSVLTTGLIAGVLWGAWHILTNDLWAAEVSAAGLPLSLYVTVSGLTLLVGQLRGVPRAHGVGLRSHPQPVVGDAHARQPCIQHVRARASCYRRCAHSRLRHRRWRRDVDGCGGRRARREARERGYVLTTHPNGLGWTTPRGVVHAESGSDTVRERLTAMKVLVVDDDQRIRDALEVGVQLQWQDAQVIAATDGEDGLNHFFDDEPDIVLLDVNMPRMNGFEVLKAIRQVSDVPVIMLTARGEDVDQVRGLELGADDYVAKPFSHLALMARIKAALRRAELPPPVQALPDFEAGDLAIHFQNQQVTVAGEQRQVHAGRIQAAVPPGAQRRPSAATSGAARSRVGRRVRGWARVPQGLRQSTPRQAAPSGRAGVHRDRTRPRLSLRATTRSSHRGSRHSGLAARWLPRAAANARLRRRRTNVIDCVRE